MVILCFALTSDTVEHLTHMRFVNPVCKFKLMIQVMVSQTICVLNAALTAGSNNFVDILLNAVGLMILNDLDNIVGALYVHIVGIGKHEHSEKQANRNDRIYSLSFAVPFVLWVLLYC